MKKYEKKESQAAVVEEPAVAYSIGNEGMRYVSLCIPQTDMNFLEELIKLRGWTLNSKDDLLDDFLVSRPMNVDLSEEDIMDEVRAVRYGKENNS